MAKSRKGFDRRHLDRKDILDIVKKYARQAGIDVDRIDSRGVGVRSLRKTTITNALNNGAPMHQARELAEKIRRGSSREAYSDSMNSAILRHYE